MNFVGAHKKITDKDFREDAAQINVSAADLYGVVLTEAAASGFDAAGRPKILFEPHVFYSRVPAAKRSKAVAAGLAYPKWGSKPYPKTSQANYDRLTQAMAIDEASALESASWGLGQIMGYNYAMCGFKSAKAMVTAFMDSEDKQVEGMCSFIVHSGLQDEMVRRDAKGFARGYNGPGYAKNAYHTKLAQNWAKGDRKFGHGMGLMDVPEDDDGGIDTTVRDAPEVAPVAAPVEAVSSPAIEDPTTVRMVQTILKSKGYTEVGSEDGQLGNFTKAAILAAKSENGYSPIDATITAEFITALSNWPARSISVERAGATKSDVRAAVPGVLSAFRTKVMGYFSAAGAGGVALVSAGADQIGTAKGYVDQIKEYAGDVPGFVWLIVVAVVALTIGLLASKTEKNGVEAYRTGERR